MFSTKIILSIGIFIGFLLACAVFIPVSIWAGYPRQRERRLEKDNDELRALLKDSYGREADGGDDGV